MRKHASKFFLIGIFLIAFFFRFSNINWDQGHHLHPDERFVTMVGIAMKPMSTFGQYLDPQTSTFNPANIGYPFYVYGTFPIVITKIIAMNTGTDTYADFTLLGRMLSAIFDSLVILYIFKTLKLLEKKHSLSRNIKYWGAFFYAIAVLPIQLSHFLAVDTFLNFFTFSSFYYIVLYSYLRKKRYIIISAILFGFALGCKISAIYYIPLILLFLFKPLTEEKKQFTKHLLYRIKMFSFFGIIVYIAARIADPYLFQNANFLDITPNKLFLDNLKTLQSWSNPEAWFPPGVQWIHKPPILFALINIIFFGLGIFYAALTGCGILVTIMKKKHWDFISIIVWMVFFFIYQSTQVSKTMRYFLFLYPFFAIFAAIGYIELTKRGNKLIQIILLLFVLIWPLMFYSIYTKPHTRTTASQWMHTFLPDGSTLLNEHWDDALPLPGNYKIQKQFMMDELKVYDPDTAEKWTIINEQLEKNDYIILSSNRAWGSIPTVPERYPKMTVFYDNLLSGKNAYKKVAEFTSYPSLAYLGIPLTINDDWAEEAFTVYDHPKVMIFQRQKE